MEKAKQKRNEKEIIVLGLSMTYALCVGVFAVIRFINKDWVIGIMDCLLALIGVVIFVRVWVTRDANVPAYALALVAVLGTIVTVAMKGSGQIYWAYPTAALVFYLLPARHALVIWGVSLILVLVLLIELPFIQLTAITLTLIITSFFCHLFSVVMHNHQYQLKIIANEDALTKVKNRRAYNQEIELLKPNSNSVSAILFDLDKFKQVNDFYGHAAGDKVLINTAKIVQKCIKNQGSMYRIGGDEFAILCLDEGFEHAFKLASNIHAQFRDTQLSQEHGVTLSMAVGQKEANETIEEWIGRLDSALYKAKKSGRNQIIKAIRY